ncbi:MAG: gamma-glutamylcyclotransferase [Anaerolineales bacterium]|nr:gamma-glutamylcyclotransferase [Anaerolineales bacterium]MCB8959891.1 gamma-glutamylcyclotransferase [Ardenticatenales bacterium]
MLYFGYCTLLDVAEMARFCPGAKPAGVAQLTGYQLCFSRYQSDPTGGSCDIVARPGHRMWGLLYEMIPAEYDELDRLAGVDKGHLARIDILVTLADGRRLAVTTYQNPGPAGPFTPTPAYCEPILRGAQAIELPATYIAELNEIIAAHGVSQS